MREMHENTRKALEPYQYKEGESGNPNGRPKGALNKKTILKKLLSVNLTDTNPVLKLLKTEFPEFFPKEHKPTIEELLFIRLIREALVSKRPISYMRELFDRTYGRSTFENVSPDDESQQTEWQRRMEILQEQLLLADDDTEDADFEEV